MAATYSLSHLKALQLKYLAFLTGSASTGTKAALQHALSRSLEVDASRTSRRVVSVDMGIRNLAYCVVDAKQPPETGDPSRALTVSTWTRRDLLSPAAPEISPLQELSDHRKQKQDSTGRQKIDTEAFTPPQLAKTAHTLVKSLLSHKPDNILIERQRFRSGGAAAIQEWTVRVNMLESMLWASLETLKASDLSPAEFPERLAIAPKRVAEFWLSGQRPVLTSWKDIFESDASSHTTQRPARAKIEKKDKVSLVQKWVVGALNENGVNLRFEGQAAEIAEAFGEQNKRGAKKIAGGKLDDLADCFLQALTYLQWEENKTLLRKILRLKLAS
ncbi:hypothetical protein CKM354_000653700 [Cercospora kikuchii]|uniref:Mitochondrial resolvase Ydc2 catalytic domain-containing protein n=1 Tax=Cercospora kikuchii TaxID=84275 RepID=A0A9P3FIB6_9PEZI|nr:uncharacterized protein CKM354_000653700 [Cercospora kikuchii]GIZ43305.1 hypothetical protein CKM354_000653700 [Cercospora kikuchii]